MFQSIQRSVSSTKKNQEPDNKKTGVDYAQMMQLQTEQSRSDLAAQMKENLPAQFMVEEPSFANRVAPSALAVAQASEGREEEELSTKPPQDRIEEYKNGEYYQEFFSPSTERGLFDVYLDPCTGCLTLLFKVNMNFIDQIHHARRVGSKNAFWTDSEKMEWTKGFIDLITARWGGQYNFINPDLPGEVVYVDIDIDEVDTNWHYQLNVTKLQKDQTKKSKTRHFYNHETNELIKEPNYHYLEMNSNDLNSKHMGYENTEEHTGALHEFGHMAGFDDEYENDDNDGVDHAAQVCTALGETITEGHTNSVMSVGNSIHQYHYTTFLEALRSVTSDNKWQFEPINDKEN